MTVGRVEANRDEAEAFGGKGRGRMTHAHHDGWCRRSQPRCSRGAMEDVKEASGRMPIVTVGAVEAN